jgi:hypothetical protein
MDGWMDGWMNKMKKILMITVIAAALVGCTNTTERGGNDDTFTVRHEGLCFVVYDNYNGAAMAQVDCSELEETKDD